MRRILAALLLLFPGIVYANSYTAVLEWDIPTQYEDGTAILPEDILKYTVHYGTTTGNYTNSVDVSPTALEGEITGLTTGTYYFAITVTTTELEVSDFSNEVNHKFTAGKSKAPVLRFKLKRRDRD
jgi:hypothetical protein